MNNPAGHMQGCPAIVGGACVCYQPAPTEMTSLKQLKESLKEQKEQMGVNFGFLAQRLAAIEQGQGILCERLDGLTKQGKEQTDKLMLLVGIMAKATTDRLDRQIDVLGGMVANQAKPKRRKRETQKGR